MNYQRASFLTSASKLSQCPDDTGLEVAFAGRSNAGKSSAINRLTNNKKLARTSRTPGRTQLINFFELDEQTRLVDLPGYGYAKVPEATKRAWQTHLENYLRERKSLKGLVLLADIRHPLRDLDASMVLWAVSAGLPVHVTLTKADKLNRGAVKAAILAMKRDMADFGDAVSVQAFSATKGDGLDVMTERLDQWLQPEPEPPALDD